MTQPSGYSVRTLQQHVGHDFGASAPVSISQNMINIFADLTDDHQWIHVDVEKAKKHSPFGGPVAHGFLTLSMMASAVNSAGVVPADAQGVINYGIDNVRFLAPVPAGASVIANVKLASVEDKGDNRQLIRIEAVVTAEGSEKPAIVGELLAMVIG